MDPSFIRISIGQSFKRKNSLKETDTQSYCRNPFFRTCCIILRVSYCWYHISAHFSFGLKVNSLLRWRSMFFHQLISWKQKHGHFQHLLYLAIQEGVLNSKSIRSLLKFLNNRKSKKITCCHFFSDENDFSNRDSYSKKQSTFISVRIVDLWVTLSFSYKKFFQLI